MSHDLIERLPTTAPSSTKSALSADLPEHASLHKRLFAGIPASTLQAEAASFLRSQIDLLDPAGCDLPESPEGLEQWMADGATGATDKYAAYLDARKAGAPRRFFTNRAHALYFLRAVAPTKLADGSWLYGLLQHWRNPKFSDLIRTYVEELGEGASDKNHVVLYRQLLARHGLDPVEDLPDAFYTQGAVQLSLACNAEEFLPEVIGFNLGYEQLPLHLLITAYELNELGIDPYYFTLHVTVDNADTGHAKRAVQATLDNLPRIGDPADFWRRARVGYQLSNAGLGTNDVIANFDIGAEVVRIFKHKSGAGQGAHSDYCRVAGRSVNDWLSDPENIPAFLAALEAAGWIKRGAPAEESRFWGLLLGDRAEMFGVFSSYELQVIHDWIRGDASADGKPFTEEPSADGQPRRPSFRVAARLAAARGQSPLATEPAHDTLDSDLQALAEQLPGLDEDGQAAMLVQAMAPSQHWTLAGLRATQLFVERSR
ncbi:MAG: hypothetical protein JWP29_5522 [Rhodoferax sp.]|nr:hypothetical protein [Rhodoferax sp.]